MALLNPLLPFSRKGNGTWPIRKAAIGKDPHIVNTAHLVPRRRIASMLAVITSGK
ncbi:hypothetical protein [Roseinatronobacter alkalisoli]|uniref:hypothetical protein n=1 Tax=Roseinatronobacter alkalisoli TaxID=3028235 RepID=UPI0023686A90|nr:hypothetical protein [Roseinatronobacter sp. HJB301]